MDKAIEEVITDNLSFESWERLAKETYSTFAVFCIFKLCCEGVQYN